MTWIQQLFGPSLDAGRLTGALLGGYAMGCLTTGYYLVRFRLGQDIRALGSGSVGARNVGRVLGAPGFLITMLGDFSKGAMVVWAAIQLTNDGRIAGVAMLASVLGHIWPAQLGFRGGKGIATSFGALACYDFRLALLLLALAAGFSLFGRMTLGGLIAFALLPLAARLLDRGPLEILVLSALAAMILLAHRRNLLDELTNFAAPRAGENKPDESLK